MLLIVLAAVVVVAALAWLGLVILRTWRSVTTFGHQVAGAGERIARVTDVLNVAMEARPGEPD